MRNIQNEDVVKRVEALREPIIDEIPVRFPWGDYFPQSKNPTDPAVQSVINVRIGLRKLVLGLKYRLQVDLDIDDTKKACLVLRDTLKSHDALINTNKLLGILSSYKLESVDSLALVSTLTEERVREFERLLDDALFRQLSENGYFLGVPGKVKKAVWEIKKIAAKIVRGRAKPLLKIAATPVKVATGGWADVSAVADLLPENKLSVLPPIAWFSAAHTTARARFEARETPAEPNTTKKFVLMPQRFSDLDSVVKAARARLGARLKTHYDDGDQSTDPKDHK